MIAPVMSGREWALVATAVVLLVVGACVLIVQRVGAAVFAAGVGALLCTAFSGDTSWNFARDHLGMTDVTERIIMFSAGECALLACAIMARANKKATSTEEHAGTPGVPGVLVWCITAVQIIPALAESGWWAGLVRAAIGPVAAAVLWHLAMGLEIRVTRPEALSTGLPAQIGHELRERLLSHLGLATRARSAEEISRDRAHARTVRLASRPKLGPWGRARLAAAVTRSRATVDGDRRHRLLQDLAGRRTAVELRTMDVVTPWVAAPAPQPHPATPLGVTGAELRRMDPVDAVRTIASAHPGTTPEGIASLVTEYGVPVSATQVQLALRPAAAHPQPDATPIVVAKPLPPTAPVPEAQESAADVDNAAVLAAPPTAPQPAAAATRHTAVTPLDTATPRTPGDALVLDLAPMLPPQPQLCAPSPAKSPQVGTAAASPSAAAASPSGVAQLRRPDTDTDVLKRARALNTAELAKSGSRVSQRQLQRELGIGQRRAQRIHGQLPATAAQPPAKEASSR